MTAWIGQLSSDDYLRSFTSLLIALLHSPNRLSRWFLRYSRGVGVQLEVIYRTRDFRLATLVDVNRHSQTETPSGKPEWTTSVKQIFHAAVDLLHRTYTSQSGEPPRLGVRHLLGAYFYGLERTHVDQMHSWGFNFERDASALLRQISASHPHEIDGWVSVHHSNYGKVCTIPTTASRPIWKEPIRSLLPRYPDLLQIPLRAKTSLTWMTKSTPWQL